MGALEDWKLAVLAQGGVAIVQDLVDAYAAQHPTNPDRRNRQSVAIHLMSLCAGLEHGLPGNQRRNRIGSWAHRDYPLLRPAPRGYAVTISDVFAAPDQGRSERATLMAVVTWRAWSEHHETIRKWLASTWAPGASTERL